MQEHKIKGSLCVLFSYLFLMLQVLWTFSIYLESVAIVPQLCLVLRTGKAEIFMLFYLFAFGSYRAMYLLNWLYRYYFENHYDLIAVVAGVVQTLIYCGFFCLYITKGEFCVRWKSYAGASLCCLMCL
jgi:ER lumen protein retaining receptor